MVRRILCGLAACVVVAGCANYKLGSAGGLPFHSLYVAPARNNGYAPQAQAEVTEQLRQALLQQGNVQLKNQAEADATLDVVLTDYRRTIAATSSNNTLNAAAYNITLSANCTLVDNRNGTVYFKNMSVSQTEETFVNSDNNLAEPEYQTMPILARDLGKKIADAVVATW
jgi:outer membrane lipopolysaccharide assembly protein LptE/RlpB